MKSNTPLIILGSVIATLLVVLIIMFLTKNSLSTYNPQKPSETEISELQKSAVLSKLEVEKLALDEFKTVRYNDIVADDAEFIAKMTVPEANDFLRKLKADIDSAAIVVSSENRNGVWYVRIGTSSDSTGTVEVVVYSKDRIQIFPER